MQSRRSDRLSAPVLTFLQGIPALSWVVFAIIWFHGTEFRILFIMVMTTLPAFTFQMLDACPVDVEGPVRDDDVASGRRAGACSAC